MRVFIAKPAKPRGFTLVEIMVVIVILSIFAGMMMLSVNSADNRKHMAFYDHLQSNISYIRLLAAEQMQPYGLAIKLAKDDVPNQLVAVKLVGSAPKIANSEASSTTNNGPAQVPQWQIASQVSPLDIPQHINVTILPLDNTPAATISPVWLTGNDAPPIVWFGTGEATPVQILLQKKNPNDETVYPIGEPILINSAGAIEAAQ